MKLYNSPDQPNIYMGVAERGLRTGEPLNLVDVREVERILLAWDVDPGAALRALRA